MAKDEEVAVVEASENSVTISSPSRHQDSIDMLLDGSESIRCLDVHGDYVAIGTKQGALAISNWKSRLPIVRVAAHQYATKLVKFSPGGNSIISCHHCWVQLCLNFTHVPSSLCASWSLMLRTNVMF